MNLVYCHGFMKEKNSIVILNLRTCLIINYLSKKIYIIEQGTKQLSLIPNDVILRINLNNQSDTDYVMVLNFFCRCKHHQTVTHSERYEYDLKQRFL